MKTGGKQEDSKITLPDTGQVIILLKNPKESHVHDVIKHNTIYIKDLSTYLYCRESLFNKKLQSELQVSKEIDNIKTALVNYDKIKLLQEERLNRVKANLEETKSNIKVKELKKEEMRLSFEAKNSQTQVLKGEIDDLLKDKLSLLTKEITESLMKEIHYVLSNESKDQKQIEIINGLVAILRNNKAVDHVIVNVSISVSIIELLNTL